jgi:hypothetical protein
MECPYWFLVACEHKQASRAAFAAYGLLSAGSLALVARRKFSAT